MPLASYGVRMVGESGRQRIPRESWPCWREAGHRLPHCSILRRIPRLYALFYMALLHVSMVPSGLALRGEAQFARCGSWRRSADY
jgi:hypothetical protein